MESKDRSFHHRSLATPWMLTFSAILVMVDVGVAAIYAFAPPMRTANAISVVAFIEGIGPYWIVSFSFAGISLFFTLVFHKLISIAHIICGAVFGGYTFALWVSVILTTANDPQHDFNPTITSVLAFGLTAGHFAMARAYAPDTFGDE